MKEVESYKGFDIFQDKESKFFVGINTPDGLVKSNQPFECLVSTKAYIDTILK